MFYFYFFFFSSEIPEGRIHSFQMMFLLFNIDVCVLHVGVESTRPADIGLGDEMGPKSSSSLWGRLWSGLFVHCAFCRELAALLGKQLEGKLPCMRRRRSSRCSWSEIKNELNL